MHREALDEFAPSTAPANPNGTGSRRDDRTSGIYSNPATFDSAERRELLDRYEALTEKYALAVERNNALTQKYVKLVRFHHERVRREPSSWKLAEWALQEGSTGWALVENERVRASNVAFSNLGAESGGEPWTRIGDEGSVRDPALPSEYPDVFDLAVGEARRLHETRAASLRSSFTGGTHVIEVVVKASDLGVPGSLLVAVSDITELARAKDRLEQQEPTRAFRELALGIVHDVNNVLGALSMRLSLVRGDPCVSSSQLRNLDAMARILRSTMTRLAALKQLGARRDRAPEAIDLRDVVISAVEIAKTGLHGSGTNPVRIWVDLPTLPNVRAFGDDLRHVFLNLFFDARDAMPEGGTIRISGHAEPDRVVVLVDDEGSGIPPSGIGQHAARMSIEKMGGSIQASNLATGGARLELRFPIAPKVPLSGGGSDPQNRV